MSVRKEVTISDALYVQFVEWHKANPEANWNQFVREAIEAKLLITGSVPPMTPEQLHPTPIG